MSAFPRLLDEFHTAILTGDTTSAAESIKKNTRIAPEEQLAIFIEGYRIRLTQAIRSDYPALLALLGDKIFDALALQYIKNHPPMGFNLDRYPHEFAAFMHDNRDDGFAAEIAALEGMIAEVFMMEESTPLTPSALTGLTPEDFGNLVLKPRNASRLLAFDYPVDDWLAAQRAGNIPSRPEKGATFLYVYRHQNNVQRVALTEAAYSLLGRLFNGLSVGEALDVPAHTESIAANLQLWFAEWMEKGFFRSPSLRGGEADAAIE